MRIFSTTWTRRISILTPGFAILFVVLAFNVVGDGLRDAFGRERRTGV